MSLLCGRHWIKPTIRPLRGRSTLPPSRQPQRRHLGGPAVFTEPTAHTQTQGPTATAGVGLEARGPLIEKYTKLRWSKNSKAPVCLKLAVQLDRGSKTAADTKHIHGKDDSDISLPNSNRSSRRPNSRPPRRPGASGLTISRTSSPTIEAEEATASAKLPSSSNGPRIRRIPMGSNFRKPEHGPFVKAEGSGASHTSGNVFNLVLRKHPVRAKEGRELIDRRGSERSIHEQTTRDRVEILIDGSRFLIRRFAFSKDKNPHGITKHHPAQAVKDASKALAIALMIRKGRTSLQPAIQNSGSLPSSAIPKDGSQHDNLALPPIRKEYGSAARSVNQRGRGPARLVIRRLTWLSKARISKVKAGPPGNRGRDSRPHLIVRRHHGAMDRNGTLSPLVISSDVIRRSSQKFAVVLPSAASTPHALSSTPPRPLLKRGVSQHRSVRRFKIRRRHSMALKRDVQSRFKLRKYPAWFLTRSRIRRRRSLTRSFEVLHKYVTNSAFRDCNVKDTY